MNISDLLNSPIGAIIIIGFLAFAAIAAWGAYRDRPTGESKPFQKAAPGPVEEKTTPGNDAEIDAGPCAVERKEIARLSGELEKAKKDGATDWKSRFEELKKRVDAHQIEDKPQVTADNVAQLLHDFGQINRKAADDLRNEAKNPEPNFDKIKGRLEQFATYCEQRGYERPDPGKLLKLLQEALK